MILKFINIINFNLARKKGLVTLPKNYKITNLIFLFNRLGLIKYYIIKDGHFIIMLNFKKIKKIKNFYKPSKYHYLQYAILQKNYKLSVNYLLILSTSKGLLTVSEAINYKLGGKLLFTIH